VHNWSKLILPLGLGVLAATINAGVMHTRVTPIQLIAIHESVERGDQFTEDNLKCVDVPYPSAHLQQHFFTWDERHVLLHTVSAAADLQAGDLVPKVEYRDFKRNQVELAAGDVELAFRVRASAISVDERRLLIPGGFARLTFRTGGSVASARISYLQPCDAAESEDAGEQYFQIGVVLNRRQHEEQILLLATQEVNRVVGLSHSGTSSL
jgi:hypothetical protein